jgi:hypothetical protein
VADRRRAREEGISPGALTSALEPGSILVEFARFRRFEIIPARVVGGRSSPAPWEPPRAEARGLGELVVCDLRGVDWVVRNACGSGVGIASLESWENAPVVDRRDVPETHEDDSGGSHFVRA